MAEREPIQTTNLDRYGNPALAWSRVRDVLAGGQSEHRTFFLGTVGPDGRPHAAGVGALWFDGDLYVVSGPGTRKSRNLAANPACTISAALRGIDLVFDGEATRVTDGPTLEGVAALYREAGWPAQVEGEAFVAPYSAPSAGPPPWHLYRFRFHTAFGVAGEEPNGATRWRFGRWGPEVRHLHTSPGSMPSTASGRPTSTSRRMRSPARRTILRSRLGDTQAER